MELTNAIKLIEKGVAKTAAAQLWADLGAGNGLFTKALATLLTADSCIYAVDSDKQALQAIASSEAKVNIETIEADFTLQVLALPLLDGMLMANALHFVAQPIPFLKRVKTLLKPSSNFILVEYDLLIANPWVPFPVSYKTIQGIAKDAGFNSVSKLGETSSIYHRSNIYSVLLQ